MNSTVNNEYYRDANLQASVDQQKIEIHWEDPPWPDFVFACSHACGAMAAIKNTTGPNRGFDSVGFIPGFVAMDVAAQSSMFRSAFALGTSMGCLWF